MARCFAYNPPNFGMEALERGEPLVDPIKKHRNKAQESKNEKRREKKGRRSSDHAEGNHKKREHKEKGSQLKSKDEHCARTNKDGSEQSEKSGLTAEHGMPCSILDPVDDSSDSIQNSSAKRRKLAEPVVVHKDRGGGGFMIRFRFPMRENGNSCITKRNVDPAGAEKTLADTSCKRIDEGISNSDWKIRREVEEAKPCITKRSVVAEKIGGETCCKMIEDVISNSDRRIRREVGEVKKLNHRSPPPFSPLPLEYQEFDDDQDWLFVTKPPPLLSGKRWVAGIQDHGSSVCSFMKHQAGIHIHPLPYVVPF